MSHIPTHLVIVGPAASPAGVVAGDAGLVAPALAPVVPLRRALGHAAPVQHEEAVLAEVRLNDCKIERGKTKSYRVTKQLFQNLPLTLI